MNNQGLIDQRKRYEVLLKEAKRDKNWWLETGGKKVEDFNDSITAFKFMIEQIDTELKANVGS